MSVQYESFVLPVNEGMALSLAPPYQL